VFMLLSCIGQRSLSNSGVLEGLLNLLDSLLSPLQRPGAATQRRTEGILDIPMISWVVMLVSRLLDYVASIEDEASGAKKNLGGKERDRPVTGIQWSFINNTLQSQNSSRTAKGSSSLDRLYSRKLRKQLVHHKQVHMFDSKARITEEHYMTAFVVFILIVLVLLQQLNLLKAKQKALVEQIEKEKIQSNKGSSYKLLVEQAKLKQATSKVLARIANATRPTIHLCEVVCEQQLERLLLLLVGTDFNRGDISWGGAWAQYSLTCMLQDILAGELMSPGSLDAMEEVVAGGEEAGASSSSADPDDSLAQPSSIPLVETIDEALVPDIIAGTTGTSTVFQSTIPRSPISSTWYDYWGADYGTYGYNPYIGGVGIPVSKPSVAPEKPASQCVSVSVSQGLRRKARNLAAPSSWN
ncbi:hypothetical protein GOODEAATRI_003498, partial [Goodea atripinnis]